MPNIRSVALTAFTGVIAVIGILASTADARQKSNSKSNDSFKREEMVLLKLKTAPKSPRFFLLQSLKETRDIQKNIDRSISQVEQADALFHKATKRSDDRSFNNTIKRLKDAQQTAQQLEQQLKDAREQLEGDVQNTLIMPKG